MAPSVDPNSSQHVLELLKLTNQARADHSLRALVRHESLDLAAQWMAQDMAVGSYIEHEDRESRDQYQRAVDFGFPAQSEIDENLYFQLSTDASVVIEEWLSVNEQRAKILRAGWVYVGIGESGGYWSVLYGRINHTDKSSWR